MTTHSTTSYSVPAHTLSRRNLLLQAAAAGLTATALASFEQETPLTTAHRFRLGSIAKAFTSTVVLQLVDEGVLTLDDTVAKWLDDPVVARIPNVDRVTLRQLTNHSSGI